jgi:ParB/RepB/Spo0J family partition protein
MTDLQTPATIAATPSGVLNGSATPGPRLPLKMLVPSRYQPRKTFKPGPLRELAENIKVLDVLAPIVVRRLPADRLQETWTDRRAGDPAPSHEIVAGERRWRAAQLAGLKSIPYLERELTDAQVAHMALAENVQREDLHPLEEAQGYRNVLDLPEEATKPVSERIAKLASEVNKSTRYIYQRLQLLKLCEFARQVFLEDLPDGSPKLHATIALEIATIGNEAQQIEATRRVCGLGRQGTDVVDDPMSQRAAAEYIRSNFRLLLSKAPFPIKVEFASVGACEACDKMSANARDLFAEGDKVPDTCMDPSCYGKKNAKHTEQLAAAAKAKGQRVITGKDAKKQLPHEFSPTVFDYRSDYQSLDEKRWDAAGKGEGKTVKQLLGNDMPAPVLIARPDGQGFVEALPKKDVERMLKERGLLKQRPGSINQAQAEADRKARLIKEQRWAVATALLQALPAIPANDPQDLNLVDQNGLRAHLMLPTVAMMLGALDHEGRKRVNKLLEIDEKTLPLHSADRVVEKYLEGLDGLGVNRFIVACLVAGEVHYAQYCHPSTDNMDMLCGLLKVDGKKISAAVAAEKKAAKTKKAAPGAARKENTAKFAGPTLAKLGAALEKAAAADQPAASTNDFEIGDVVRFKEGLKSAGGKSRKVSGREGTIKAKVGDRAWSVQFGAKAHELATADHTELELVRKGTAPDPNAAWPFPTTGAKKSTKATAKKPAKKAAEDKVLAQGELTLSTGVKLSPQPAWPFPTASKNAASEGTAK